MARKKNTEKELYWRELVDRQAGSGLSIREYCAKEGISQPSFFAWRKRFREQASAGRRAAGRAAASRRMAARSSFRCGCSDSASALVVIHPLRLSSSRDRRSEPHGVATGSRGARRET